MTDDEIFDVIRPIILTVTGVPECIKADPNAPAPSGSYAVVRVDQQINERGQANISRANVPGENSVETTVKSQIVASCTVDFYRDNAMNYAALINQANKRPDVSQTLFLANLGWAGTSSVLNLTTLQSAQQEQRAMITITLLYVISQSVIVNSIEQVGIVVQDENANVLDETNVRTPDAPD